MVRALLEEAIDDEVELVCARRMGNNPVTQPDLARLCAEAVITLRLHLDTSMS